MPAPIDMTGSNVVDPGTYVASVAQVTEGTSKGAKTAGALTFNVRFKLADQPRSVFETFYVAPNTVWKLTNFLLAAGFQQAEINAAGQDAGTDEDPYPTLRQLVNDTVGVEVALDVGVRTANGQYKERNEVVKFQRPEQAFATAGLGW